MIEEIKPATPFGEEIQRMFEEDEVDEYMGFEPWDVGERSKDFFRIATKDGLDFEDPNFVRIYGKAPHPFQTGMILDTNPLNIALGASRIGKSYPRIIEAVSAMTGVFPISLRYPEGYDTGIKRMITPANIRRFGRFDARTGSFIDHAQAQADLQSWNCGTIKGAGVFPQEKVMAENGTVWIGTYKEAKIQFWFPFLKRMIPTYLLDKKRGLDGFSEMHSQFYFLNNCTGSILTYEQDDKRFEAIEAFLLILDEEPPTRQIYVACLLHGKYVRLTFTPFRGLTWTYEDIIQKIVSGELKIPIYHATQYDSPYRTSEVIKAHRQQLKQWEIQARIYGLHSEQKGKPFFDRDLINAWITKHVPSYKTATFMPPHFLCPADLFVKPTQMVEGGEVDQEKDVWKIYEDVKPDGAYVCCCDTSRGAAEACQAGDRNSAIMFRKAVAPEKDPVMVASLRSTLETIEFSRVVLPACAYYNNALLAPEIRGADGASFLAVTRDWPYYFKMSVTRWSDRKTAEIKGFDTNAKTRRMIFDLIGDYIKGHADNPGIPFIELLKELAACVVGDKGRPDHTTEGSLDSAIPFGIGLFVFTYFSEQVINNRISYEQRKRHDPRRPVVETRPVLGSKRGLDARERLGHLNPQLGTRRGRPTSRGYESI